MSSHPVSRALPSRRIDAKTRPLPTLLPNVLDAKTCRFHAASAGRIAMTTAHRQREADQRLGGARIESPMRAVTTASST